MTSPASARPLTVALLGNPNTGKSTLFSGLVGVRQRTGNYPGVTVEKKLGRATFHHQPLDVLDLPGTYSLAPHSPDEMVAVEVLLGRQSEVPPPDVVVCIVDASNLSRNLYLVSQILELQRPVVVALNMVDVAESKGMRLDVERLRANLGVPVVPVQANKQRGLDELQQAIVEAARVAQQGSYASPLPEAFQAEVRQLLAEVAQRHAGLEFPRYLMERLVLDTGYLEKAGLPGVDAGLRESLAAARARLTASGQSLAALETIARYQWVAGVTDGVVTRTAQPSGSLSDRLDRILTHRVYGVLVFIAIVLAMFLAVFRGAVWFMDGIEGTLGAVGERVAALLPPGPLQSLIVDGIIAGVGGVLVFLPQICILFFLIALLEDCGYMARAAYLMDRLMSRIGLSGKSFIPLLSSFACAVPGIMATRVIEDRRDRLVTILIAPLMSCSARLPVYTLLVTMFATSSWQFVLTVAALYLLGLLAAVVVALVLKRTLLPGETPAFVMELPSYKIPDLKVVLHRMVERGWEFVRRAGTLIFAVSILVWAAGYFPRNTGQVEGPFAARQAELAEQLDAARQTQPVDENRVAEIEAAQQAIDQEIAGAYIRDSYLGRMGRWIEPIVKPLGWDWRIGCAAIASFPAREVVVGTLGVIYNLGQDDGSDTLRETLRAARWDGTDRPVFTYPTALSIMVFFALCAQCVSTLVVIRRETNSWRWPVFCFVYMTLLAYVAAFITYQVGSRILG
jgi:ferrous iron transport protein B